MNQYQHPPTFRATSDLSRDFRHSAEDYDVNVAPFLPEDLDSLILDVGCGWGQFLWWLRQRGYRAIEGIDLGAEQVESCRGLGLTAEHMTDSAEYLRARPNHFDLITMHHIIEHVDPVIGLELLRAAYSALRPGGRIIVQTPNMNATSSNFSRYIELTHVTGFTDSSLAEALGMTGFVGVRVYGNKTPFHWHPKRIMWLALQRASRLLWRAMLFAELGSDAPRTLNKNIYGVGYRPR
jgi:SAM-dependent methyltransferase